MRLIHSKWIELKKHDIVWELGMCRENRFGKLIKVPYLYGPFQVIDLGERVLRNSDGKEFMHFQENLYQWREDK